MAFIYTVLQNNIHQVFPRSDCIPELMHCRVVERNLFWQKSPLTTLANYAQYRPPRDLVSHLENTIDMQKLD